MKYNLAIMGAGKIAQRMGETVQRTDIVHGYAIASRELSRAEKMAEEYGFQKAYGSYDEMLADPAVDLVYIATPHVFHAAQIEQCLRAGKHVLCEKSFTINAGQARRVTALAQEKGLLLAEAIWPRYMPMAKTLRAFAAGDKIGRIHSLTANLGYPVYHRERLHDRSLGGGALLDVGIYPLTFASLILGDEVTEIRSSASLSDTGVDTFENIVLTYASGAQASIFSSITGPTDRRGVIYGEEGYAEVGNVNNYEYLRLYDADHRLLEETLCPPQVTGFEYELAACAEAISHGWTQCPDAPHEMSVRMMDLMDKIRRQWGLEYPEL